MKKIKLNAAEKLKIKKFRAFSLIELSIVVLVIGLIVVAVLGGKKLVTLSNLSKARALTNSSPVSGIEDLTLWLETTSKTSFTSVPTDGTAIGSWLDANPQKTVKYNAVEATNRPVYTASAINGLPALTFDGANDELAGNIEIPGSEMTAFVVAKRNAAVNDASTVTIYTPLASVNDYDSPSAVAIAYEGSAAEAYNTYRNGNNLSIVPNNLGNGVAYILTCKFDGTNNTLYLNGLGYTPVASSGVFASTNYVIGARYQSGVFNYFYNGSIGEVIIYNRALSDFERQQVEQYLSKKWGIKLT